MAIFHYQIKMYLPECHSLKDKRSVIKSLIAKLQKKFNISCAEIDFQDVWQTALVGIVWISENSRLGNSVLDSIRTFTDESFPNIIVIEESFERR
jgi:uncharacterized protein YlxP (DUF503 family)